MATPPLRVVRIIARLNIGGPAIQAALLTSSLDKAEFDSTLVTGTEGMREGNMLELAVQEDFAAGVEPIVIPALGRSPSPIRDLVAFISLLRLMRRMRPDIVHTHTAKAGTLGRIAAWLTGVPVIVHTFHGNVFTGYFGPFISKLIVLWERLLAKISTAVIAISDRQGRDLSEAGFNRSKIRVIPLGLPLERFAETVPAERRALLRSQLGIPDGSLAIGFVARLVPVKNPELLLDALDKLQESKPGIHLVVAGDGPLREDLNASAARLGIDLKMLGWRGDLNDVYPALDAVALSSRNEGLPVALIEAMAAGIPVASTNVGGVADLLEDGKLGTLASQDAESLAEAIAAALSAPKDQIADARNSVLERFGEGRLLRDIGALYHELAESKANAIKRRRGFASGPAQS